MAVEALLLYRPRHAIVLSVAIIERLGHGGTVNGRDHCALSGVVARADLQIVDAGREFLRLRSLDNSVVHRIVKGFTGEPDVRHGVIPLHRL